MTVWGLVTIISLLIIVGLVLAWLVLRVGELSRGPKAEKDKNTQAYDQAAHEDVEHIFNDEFRSELRNRGRLHFEKIIGENAMFLQQDLRLTTSQLNEYMKTEITK